MQADELIALADSCSEVRTAIGHLLLLEASGEGRDQARERLRRTLRELLRGAREQDCGLYLEVAGELASS